jgi:transposase-like protein
MDNTETSAIPKLFNLTQIAAAFRADCLDAGRCEALVLELLHQGETKCPRCGVDLQGQRQESFQAWGRVRCAECGKWFTATTGTALHKVKLDARQLVMLSYLLSIGVHPSMIGAAAGVDPETVRTWELKFQALTLISGKDQA